MHVKKTAAVVAAALGLLAVLAPGANALDYGPYSVTNLAGPRCLDAAAQYNGANGTPVQLWDCYGPGQLNQQWYLRYVSYYSEYQVVNKASGRCLDAAAQYNGANGSPIQLWDCYGPGQLNQVWYVYRDSGDHYILRSKGSGRVVDAAAQYNSVNGTPIQLWDDLGQGQLNQRWHM